MNILQLLSGGAPAPAPVATGDPSVTAGIPGFGDFSGGAQDPGAAQPQGVSNVLQTMPGGNADASLPPPVPVQPAAAPAATQPARSRSSVLDKIGRVADVLATVGGATPLYQPTLDARQNRTLALGDHDRAVTGDLLDQDAKRADIDQTHGAIAETQNTLRDAAINHLQAMVAANPNTDIGKVWPMLAAQARMSPEETAHWGEIFASDPKSIEAMASGGAADKEKYGGLPVYVRDPQGNLHIRQLSLNGSDARDPLPEGWTPADPTKAVNFGGVTGFVGAHSDTPSNYVANTEKPGTEADRAERAREADNHNAIAIYQADAKRNGGKATANPSAGLAFVDNLQKGFDALHNMGALPGDTNNPVTGIAATLGRTGVGQWLTAQAGTQAGQMRQQVYKNLSLLQQEMIKSLPASATRSRFEQEIIKKGMPDPAMMSYDTANNVLAEYRRMYSKALSDASAELGGSGQGGTRARPTLRPYGSSGGAPAVPVTKPVLPSTPRGGLHDLVPWGKR